MPHSAQESAIENKFNNLVSHLVGLIGSSSEYHGQIKYSVGGLLAHENYAFNGITDSVYSNNEGSFALATVLKTAESWPRQHLWYRSTRSAQVLATAYASLAPTMLLHQNLFKAFIADTMDCSGGMFTFPPMHGTLFTDDIRFLEILSICFLASDKRAKVEAQAVSLLHSVKIRDVFIPLQMPSATKLPSHSSSASMADITAGLTCDQQVVSSESDSWLPLTFENVRRHTVDST